jgi:hypothetical protein
VLRANALGFRETPPPLVARLALPGSPAHAAHAAAPPRSQDAGGAEPGGGASDVHAVVAAVPTTPPSLTTPASPSRVRVTVTAARYTLCRPTTAPTVHVRPGTALVPRIQVRNTQHAGSASVVGSDTLPGVAPHMLSTWAKASVAFSIP